MANLFFDLDGTLLGKSRVLHPKTKQAIREAREHGSRVFLCSGRSPIYLQTGICREIEVDGIIACAGGVVLLGDELVFENRLDDRLLEEILTAFKREGIGYELDTALGVFESEHFMEDFEGVLEAKLGNDPAWRASFAKERAHDLEAGIARAIDRMPEGTAVQKIVFAGPRPGAERVLETLGDTFALNLFLESETAVSGEIIPKSCTKQRGIEEVLAHFGEDKETAVGFGDSMNDLEMLTFVGTGVAYEYAPAPLLAAARRTFKDPDAGGIAEVLYALGLATDPEGAGRI